jgi:hypothetical protein
MRRIASLVVALFVLAVLAYWPGAVRATSGSHMPIVIASDSDFQLCGCVASGSGSTADPYVIGPFSINKTGDTDTAVSIDGTLLTKSFVLLNLTIAGNGAPSSVGILLNHLNPSGTQTISASVQGTQTSIQSSGIGILLENSRFVTVDGGNANPNGAGIGTGAVGTINRNFTGAIDIENSSNIIVRGWQMSANGQDNAPDYIEFDPSLSVWGVGAVRLFASNNVIIDHNAANNCTTVSFPVFTSSHNTISNNTADYPFTSNVMITDGSSYNLISDNVFSTADFVGILIADPLPGTQILNVYGAATTTSSRGMSVIPTVPPAEKCPLESPRPSSAAW